MMNAGLTFSVFTKPWKTPLPELAAFVKGMGFDAVELPVRPGYQVTPEAAASQLPLASRIFADAGIAIVSIAGPADEPTIAACGAASIERPRSAPWRLGAGKWSSPPPRPWAY